MAFIKFKPLTPKFNFHSILSVKDMPKYVHDYIDKDEKVMFAYNTSKDVAIFTNKQIILFDKNGLFHNIKEISSIPYHSIVTSSVYFGAVTTEIRLTLYNTFPLTLRFLGSVDKVQIKYTYMLLQRQIKDKYK
ncbi:MAG: PH domain-containing protein [Bacilli bacterium]|nr:PH domain-containing protein [Bacilli bacterium]